MQKKYFKNQKGFTIIEMMIAIAIFLIIVMIGMGALLNANLVHNKSRDMRSILDNLSFVMDEMSRNIRTGSEYSCTGGSSGTFPDCIDGNEISFKRTDINGTTDWKYFFDINNGDLLKEVGSDQVKLIDGSQISMNSGIFSVSGANSGDNFQPFVTIRLNGSITTKGIVTPFSLQTSVSQRLMDLPMTP
jgi:prepilin-type N-terminal cleavage/methylation domain-containing protein